MTLHPATILVLVLFGISVTMLLTGYSEFIIATIITAVCAVICVSYDL